MATLTAQPVGKIRLGTKGQITVPSDYRTLHKLSTGSEVFLIELGNALMVVPVDRALEHLCRQIQEGLAGQGISTEHALQNLAKVRRRRFRRLYGKR
ncbi:MAG: AbrB/MazE/SpoVT family DNA-binding domain-containing protein [Nitrospira sp. LK70]|nr:AbrB/MazE/SpoVT family DNA-binding domain-containing protein [Nitrospira sp. LK70]